MTNVITFMQNILVSAFVASFVFVSVYIPQPLNQVEKAAAQEIVSDLIAHTLQILNNLYTIAMHAFQQALYNKELVLDPLLFALAKAILETITNSIVRWVNSGLDGAPYFIQDLRSTLDDIAYQELQYYLDEINGPNSFICEPFRMDISIALEIAYEEREEFGYPQGGVCDPSGPMANIEEFYAGDFEAGGWEAWYEMVNRPAQYTSYGSYLAADRRAGQLQEEARRTQVTEANWSDGFFSRKQCTSPTTPYGRPSCKIITPGDSIAESLNFHLSSGSRVLIEADEINELLGSLLTYIAQNVVTGAGGLLGYDGSGTSGGGGDPGGGGVVDTSSFENLLDLVGESRSDHITWLNGTIRDYGVELTAMANDPTVSEAERSLAQSEADSINQVIIPELQANIDDLTELYDVILGYVNNPPINPSEALRSATNEYNSLVPNLFTAGEIDSLANTWDSILSG